MYQRAGSATSTAQFLHVSSNGNIFRVAGPYWGESTGHQWISLTKAGDEELWYFIDLRQNKQLNKTNEQTLETSVIWDTVALISTSL